MWKDIFASYLYTKYHLKLLNRVIIQKSNQFLKIRFQCTKILFRSVPLFIITSVGNYNKRNGTEQNDIMMN